MSSTALSKVPQLERWLHLNAFWNADIVEIKESETFDGLGVFVKSGAFEEDDDTLLLRIPKANILSSKNSSIANLIEDYAAALEKSAESEEGSEENEDDEEPEIDLTVDLHSLVLCFIYEQSVGESSPWFDYIDSIDIENTQLPLCLWDEEDKRLLMNTECDLLHMLEVTEILELYIECVRFAKYNEKYIPIPEVLRVEDGDEIDVAKIEKSESLRHFGRILQVVLSRSFPIDGYHGLAMVPGADIFNHGEVEDVEFVREEDICEACGEKECEHDQEDESFDEEEEDEEDDLDELDDDELELALMNEDDNEDDAEVEEEGQEEEEGKDAIIEDVDGEDEELASDGELESSEDEDDFDAEGQDSEDDMVDSDNSETDEVEDEEVIETITTEFIEEMERQIEAEEHEESGDEEIDSEAEIDEDEQEVEVEAGGDENESDLELSEDENPDGDELGKQLATDQCCDIILLNPKEGEEIFNSYGDLSNPYLLQRYGFIEELNYNDSCTLTVQMFSYMKKFKGKKAMQLDMKVQWYEQMGFELVNDLLRIGLQTERGGECCGEEHEDNEEHGCCGEGEDDEDDDDDDLELESDEPLSWELSPKVAFDGSPTPQTYALLRLFLMPFNLFQAKFLLCQSESKLCRRILSLLLPNAIPISHPRRKSEHEKVFQVLNSWCKNRLNRYKDGLTASDYQKLLQEDVTLSKQKRTIFKLLKEEKEILARGCTFTAEDYASII